MAARLQERYQEEIVSKLKEEFGYRNPHQVPTMTKVVVNIGMGEATQNSKLLDKAMEELTSITGQKPALRRAKKSVSNFRLREGQGIGAMVTLRGKRMWEFLDRLFTVALPRVRDFGGVSEKAFDGRGNYTLGVRDQTIFPEVDYDAVERVTGMNVTMVTSAATDAEGRALLRHLGVPFRP
ncbi:MAG: 50S ribosomal protein L5 [Myxococcota bacterium]|jgi:large subunit ribosomal protein L5|nr:50S ribosomal protein L5 [Myxococcota bacterium]